MREKEGRKGRRIDGVNDEVARGVVIWIMDGDSVKK